jgi:hypothetical protein
MDLRAKYLYGGVPRSHPGRSGPGIGGGCLKQYIGDLTKMVVHNQLNKKPECCAEAIPSEAIKQFDALHQAVREGFKKCPECIGDGIW